MSLPELLMRLAQDSGHSLDGRMLTVTGFTMKADGRTDLGRVVIICCAADAQLARIRLGGPAAAEVAGLPDNTWVMLEGKVPARQGDSSGGTQPLMEVYHVSRTDPPSNTYAY